MSEDSYFCTPIDRRLLLADIDKRAFALEVGPTQRNLFLFFVFEFHETF